MSASNSLAVKLAAIKMSLDPIPPRSAEESVVRDPNEDPSYVLDQVRPLLMKMKLYNMVDKGKDARIEVGDSNLPAPAGKEIRLYHVILKRLAEISLEQIENIKRNDKWFHKMVWTSQAMELYVWYEYVPLPAGKIK